MLSGNILDVYPDYQRNVMVTWLVGDGRATRVEEVYEPSFYVYSSSKDLPSLAKVLESLPQVKHVRYTLAKLVLGSEKQTMVLEVIPKTLRSLRTLAAMVDSWGGYHEYQLFNVDLRLPTRYLLSRGVFCHAWVKWDGKQFMLDDEQWALDYEVPSLRVLSFDVKQKTRGNLSSFDSPISSIVLGDETVQEENEGDTIRSAMGRIKKIDPDVLSTVNGDTVVFPFLYHRAKVCGIHHEICLGREQSLRRNTLEPVKEGKS